MKFVLAYKRKEAYAVLLRVYKLKRMTEQELSRKPTSDDLAKREQKKAKRLTWLEVAAAVADAARLLKPIPVEHWPYLWQRFRDYGSTVVISTALKRREVALKQEGSHSDNFARLMAYVSVLTSREQASLYYEIVWLAESRSWWEYNQSTYSAEADQLLSQLQINALDVMRRHLGEIRERKQKRQAALAHRSGAKQAKRSRAAGA